MELETNGFRITATSCRLEIFSRTAQSRGVGRFLYHVKTKTSKTRETARVGGGLASDAIASDIFQKEGN